MLLNWNVILRILDLVHQSNVSELVTNVLVGHQKVQKILSHVVVKIKLYFNACITKKQKYKIYVLSPKFVLITKIVINQIKNHLLLTKACSNDYSTFSLLMIEDLMLMSNLKTHVDSDVIRALLV